MKLARILARPGEPGGRHAGCLDEAALAALVDGGLPPAERADLEAHLADCEWCVRRLALLTSLAGEEVAGEPLPEGARRVARSPLGAPSHRHGSARWAAAAAVIALLSAGLGWQLSEMRHSRGEVPGAPTPQVRGSQRVVDEHTGIDLLAPVGSTLSLDAERLIQWSAVPESLSYTVTLTAADGTPLWEEESRTTEIRLPNAVALDPGATYYLQVRAHLPDGRTLRSGHIELELGEG